MDITHATPKQRLAFWEGQALALAWTLNFLDGNFVEDRHANALMDRLDEVNSLIKMLKKDHKIEDK